MLKLTRLTFLRSGALKQLRMELVKSSGIKVAPGLRFRVLSENFDRVRKTKVDGIQAVCCSKSKESKPEYAIGCTTGQIKVLEFSEKNTLIGEFAAGK